jgi:hypothetical protein
MQCSYNKRFSGHETRGQADIEPRGGLTKNVKLTIPETTKTVITANKSN